MQYRKEIDGLRAVAVLPVILFHAGFSGFGGGYLGVDVFFVLSGFLITSIILEEKTNARFSLLRFYERRARRILPALSLVLLVSTCAAYLLMPPDLLRAYSQSLVAVVVFASNLYFYLTTGYFSTAADEKPLLHTWSLAVEEQYYFVFPLLLSLFWYLKPGRLKWLMVFLALTSFGFSQYLGLQQAHDANFYLLFSRAWELLAGSVMAFVMSEATSLSPQGRKNELLSGLGLLLIVYALVFGQNQLLLPGLYSLLAVIGTCLVIVYGNQSTRAGRFLSQRPLVFVGLLSYSLYLWHQPLFAFLRMKTLGEPPGYLFGVCILLTFVCAFLSWKFIERPFRDRALISRPALLRFTAASTLVFLLMGVLGYFQGGFPQRFQASVYAKTVRFSPLREKCHTYGKNHLKPEAACHYFGKNIRWAVLGDSHVVEPAYALAKRLEPHGDGLLHLSFSSCSPPALVYEVQHPGCSDWLKASLLKLENSPQIKNVLVGFRYSDFLFGEQLNTYPDLPNEDPIRQFSEPSKKALKAQAVDISALYWRSFTDIIRRLQQAGKTVYILYPIPELPMDINKMIVPFSVFGGSAVRLESITSVDYYLKRNQYILGKLNSLNYGPHLQAVKPFDILCSEASCAAVKAQKSMYFDDNHLSLAGAELLIEALPMTQTGKFQKTRAK